MGSHSCTQEVRISNLEAKGAVADTNISHLVKRLDSLTSVLYTISVLLGGSLVTALGFLITYWVKGTV
jgi:hypothetical protein